MAGLGDKQSKQRPYLLRAMHEWMLDNDLTPHILVDATREGLVIPGGQAKDGKLVLNVSPSATRGLSLANDIVSFETRFGGVAHHLEIPVDAVLGIYARESGNGMLFPEENAPDQPDPSGSPAPDSAEPKKPTLTIVK